MIGSIGSRFLAALHGNVASVEEPRKTKTHRITVSNVVIDTETGDILDIRPLLTRKDPSLQWKFTTMRLHDVGVLARQDIPER